MKTSCGALFYTYDLNGQLGIVLGLEGVDWLPFKGCNELGETLEETAIREVREETCGLVKLDKIELEHQFTSKRKHYHIGLCEVPYDIIDTFSAVRAREGRVEYKEKKRLRFFSIDTILENNAIHNISKASVMYYWNKLMSLKKSNVIDQTTYRSRLRKHSVGILYAQKKYPAVDCDTTDSSDSSDSTDDHTEHKSLNNSQDYRKSSIKVFDRNIKKKDYKLLRKPNRFNLQHNLQHNKQKESISWRKSTT